MLFVESPPLGARKKKEKKRKKKERKLFFFTQNFTYADPTFWWFRPTPGHFVRFTTLLERLSTRIALRLQLKEVNFLLNPLLISRFGSAPKAANFITELHLENIPLHFAKRKNPEPQLASMEPDQNLKLEFDARHPCASDRFYR
jgi:hypothetical protein